jgi:hypothetical protein
VRSGPAQGARVPRACQAVNIGGRELPREVVGASTRLASTPCLPAQAIRRRPSYGADRCDQGRDPGCDPGRNSGRDSGRDPGRDLVREDASLRRRRGVVEVVGASAAP